jgi:hypothetical protein
MKKFNEIRTSKTLPEEITRSISSLTKLMESYDDVVIQDRLQEMIDDLSAISQYDEVISESLNTTETPEYYDNMIEAIATSLREETDVEVQLSSGEIVCITPKMAKVLSNTYDSLNEDNAEIMMTSLTNSLSEFDAILDFADSNFITEEE